jgi:hypothetical protein
MGGRESLRGYLVQTMASLLEALHTNNDWEAVSLEPLHESEKVDVKWRFPDRIKVVQIKSSQNPFGEQQIKAWCTDLANSTEADQYELRLVGTLTSRSSKPLREYSGVCIPPPIPLNVEGMLKGITYDLSVYCERHTIPIPRPLMAGILARALVLQLEGRTRFSWLRGDYDPNTTWLRLSVTRSEAKGCGAKVRKR